MCHSLWGLFPNQEIPQVIRRLLTTQQAFPKSAILTLMLSALSGSRGLTSRDPAVGLPITEQERDTEPINEKHNYQLSAIIGLDCNRGSLVILWLPDASPLADWPFPRGSSDVYPQLYPSSPSPWLMLCSSSPSSSSGGRNLPLPPLPRAPLSSVWSCSSSTSAEPLQAGWTGDSLLLSSWLGCALPLCWSSSLHWEGLWSAATWPLQFTSDASSGPVPLTPAFSAPSKKGHFF